MLKGQPRLPDTANELERPGPNDMASDGLQTASDNIAVVRLRPEDELEGIEVRLLADVPQKVMRFSGGRRGCTEVAEVSSYVFESVI